MTRAADQMEEAVATLSAAHPGPAAAEIVWAVGVFYGQHPWNLTAAWRGEPLIGHELHGATLENHLWIFASSGRITIGLLEGDPIVALSESTVRRLIHPTRLPADLIAEVRALHEERSAHALAEMRRWTRYQHGEAERPTDEERDALFAVHCSIERRCEDAGARVWDHVRPRRQPEQLDLFSALAGGAR